MDTKHKIPVPTIHSNGTSREELLRQLIAALDALYVADAALADATPHGRDYYQQNGGGEVIYDAARLHAARRAAIAKIIQELSYIAKAI